MTSSGTGHEQDHVRPDTSAADRATSAEFGLRDGLSHLDGLDARPLVEHAPVYEALHEQLQAVLTEIDGA